MVMVDNLVLSKQDKNKLLNYKKIFILENVKNPGFRGCQDFFLFISIKFRNVYARSLLSFFVDDYSI